MPKCLLPLLAAAGILFLACACARPFPPHTTPDGYTFFYRPETRAENASHYFTKEFSFIHERLSRSKAAALGGSPSGRPKVLIGLALSGGGIRSSAFQLGVLNGLHRSEYPRSDKSPGSLLDNVAYLSTVSGGTWAAAGFLANGGTTEQFFDMLNAIAEKDRSKITCDEKPETSPDTCPEGIRNVLNILNNSYRETAKAAERATTLSDPLDLFTGYTVREEWRKMLLKKQLLGMDMWIDGLKDKTDKPFLIANTTHSATSLVTTLNFPFQITPLGAGTIADCGNTWGYCPKIKSYAGFFREYDAHNATGHSLFTAPLLSQVMAMSGAVIPERILGKRLNLMEWEFPLPQVKSAVRRTPEEEAADCPRILSSPEWFKNYEPLRNWGVLSTDCMNATDFAKHEERSETHPQEYFQTIKHNINEPVQRPFYVLGDGGHSENLGSIALLERGVDLLIISDGALDVERTFEDYGNLKHHAGKLLKKRLGFATEILPDLFWAKNATLMKEMAEPAWRDNATIMHEMSQPSWWENATITNWLDQYSYAKNATAYEWLTIPRRAETAVRWMWLYSTNASKVTEGKNVNNREPSIVVSTEIDNEIRRFLRPLREEYDLHRDNPELWPSAVTRSIFYGYYDTTDPKDPKRQEHTGKVIYLKPPCSISSCMPGRADGFLEYLAGKATENPDPYNGYYATWRFLKMNACQLDFPNDKTFALSYERELIFAYYLLGTYIAEKHLAPAMREFLDRQLGAAPGRGKG